VLGLQAPLTILLMPAYRSSPVSDKKHLSSSFSSGYHWKHAFFPGNTEIQNNSVFLYFFKGPFDGRFNFTGFIATNANSTVCFSKKYKS